MDENRTRCMGCMEELPEGVGDFCPRCGRRLDADNDPHMLPVGTVLASKYVVGRALGQGGFGITYLGWDGAEKRPVAIKEYYPGGLAVRQRDGFTVSPVSYQSETGVYERGRERFLNEAGRLGQFRAVAGVVSEYEYFEANGTAYIVMEYVRGRTLKEYLGTLPRPMELEDAIAILEPVTKALEAIHAAGMIHRDVSPDNIMIMPNGVAKLLDFGSARDMSVAGEFSNTVNVKMGYAPGEQYATHGDQRAWTDEYALAATIYRCVTGQVPESATERSAGAQLTSPRSLGANISVGSERVLLKGMAMRPEDRYPTVTALMAALSRSCGGPGDAPARRVVTPTTAAVRKNAAWVMLAATALCVVAVFCMSFIYSPGYYAIRGSVAGAGMVLTLAALVMFIRRGEAKVWMAAAAGVSAVALTLSERILGSIDLEAEILIYRALVLTLATDCVLLIWCYKADPKKAGWIVLSTLAVCAGIVLFPYDYYFYYWRNGAYLIYWIAMAVGMLMTLGALWRYMYRGTVPRAMAVLAAVSALIFAAAYIWDMRYLEVIGAWAYSLIHTELLLPVAIDVTLIRRYLLDKKGAAAGDARGGEPQRVKEE